MLQDTIIKSFLSMLLMVGVFGLIIFILRKYIKKAKNKANPVELNVISKTTIQAKTHLYIVKAGNKTLLLGATDHNINTLADLTEQKMPVAVNYTAPKKLVASAYKNADDSKNQLVPKSKTDENSLSFKTFLKSTLTK